MASDSHLIVKCPACGNKFKAERQAEASVVLCVACQSEIRLSGIDESRRKQAAKLPRIRHLPEKQDEPNRLVFQDLARKRSSSSSVQKAPGESSPGPTLAPRVLQRTDSLARKRRERVRNRAASSEPGHENTEDFPAPPGHSTPVLERETPVYEDHDDPEVEVAAGDEASADAGEWKRRKFFLFDRTPAWDDRHTEKRKRRKPDRIHRKLRTLARMLVVGVLICGAAIVIWQSFQNPLEIEGASGSGIRSDTTVLDRFTAAVPVIESFLRAKSIDEMLPYVRNPDVVRPLMELHYGRRGVEPTSFSRIGPLEESSIVNGFLVTPVYTADFRSFAIGVDGSTPPHVDWESFVAYCEVPVAQFHKQRLSTPTLLRVRMRPDSFYDGEFDDPDAYASFRIAGADEKTVFWGYMKRDSPAYSRWLTENAGAGQEESLATIRARYPDAAAAAPQDDPMSSRIIVDDFLTLGWILRDS